MTLATAVIIGLVALCIGVTLAYVASRRRRAVTYTRWLEDDLERTVTVAQGEAERHREHVRHAAKGEWHARCDYCIMAPPVLH